MNVLLFFICGINTQYLLTLLFRIIRVASVVAQLDVDLPVNFVVFKCVQACMNTIRSMQINLSLQSKMKPTKRFSRAFCPHTGKRWISQNSTTAYKNRFWFFLVDQKIHCPHGNRNWMPANANIRDCIHVPGQNTIYRNTELNWFVAKCHRSSHMTIRIVRCHVPYSFGQLKMFVIRSVLCRLLLLLKMALEQKNKTTKVNNIIQDKFFSIFHWYLMIFFIFYSQANQPPLYFRRDQPRV